jgi:hypothetical protein
LQRMLSTFLQNWVSLHVTRLAPGPRNAACLAEADAPRWRPTNLWINWQITNRTVVGTRVVWRGVWVPKRCTMAGAVAHRLDGFDDGDLRSHKGNRQWRSDAAFSGGDRNIRFGPVCRPWTDVPQRRDAALDPPSWRTPGPVVGWQCKTPTPCRLPVSRHILRGLADAALGATGTGRPARSRLGCEWNAYSCRAEPSAQRAWPSHALQVAAQCVLLGEPGSNHLLQLRASRRAASTICVTRGITHA